MRIRIGTASRVITPAAPVDLSGYAGRIQPCDGVLDDVCARCAVLEKDGRRVAIVQSDILGLDMDQVASIAASLAPDGYKPDDLLLCGTHTHSGPAVQQLWTAGTPDPSCVSRILAEIAQCVRDAGRTLTDCEVFAGSSACHLGLNRRRITPQGVEHVPNEEGERDPEVAVLQFRDTAGKAVATLFNYTCHGVIMGPESRKVSADWPGDAMRKVAAACGGLGLFLQGCCGDVNPCFRGTYPQVHEAADMVVAAVEDALKNAAPVAEGALESVSWTLALPLLPLESDEWMRKRLAEIQAKDESARDFADQRDLMLCAGVLEHPESYRRDHRDVRVGEIRLGDACIAWLPGEAFSAYSRNIKAARKLGRTMGAGYANGNIGYIPKASAYPEGGYEVTDAHRYYGRQMIGPETEKLILDAFGAQTGH